MRRKGTSEQLAIVRKQGLALLEKGKKAEEVAEILSVTPRSVYRWRQENKQPKAKKATRPIGRPRKLTEKQVKQLEKALDRGAYAFGYSGDDWTLDRIAQVIWQLFKVRCHPTGVWHIMVRMGWSNQRPQRLALQRNDEAVEAWKKEVLPEIKKTRDLNAILGLEEAGFTAEYIWAQTKEYTAGAAPHDKDELQTSKQVFLQASRERVFLKNACLLAYEL